MKNKLTIEKLITHGYVLNHTSLFRGYVSRKNNTEIIKEYNGKFGKGYTVKRCNFNSTNYSFISYFLKK